jgi:AraC-like DNA-binding protein
MLEVERAVAQVIEAIHKNYGDELSIDDMARTAMYSKFHFTRIFQRVTGLTPGRFLSAVRLQKAKELLTSTSLTVTDISHMVGYASIGTFSSRFSYSVGVPPSMYRRLGGHRPWVAFESGGNGGSGGRRHGKPPGHRGGTSGTRSAGRGAITLPEAAEVRPIFVGLFPGKIPEGEPVRCTILMRPGQYVLEDVPEGTWYVMACSPRDPGGYAPVPQPVPEPRPQDETMLVAHHGPIDVYPGTVHMADCRLRLMNPLDPPVLLALPDLRPEVLPAEAHSAA